MDARPSVIWTSWSLDPRRAGRTRVTSSTIRKRRKFSARAETKRASPSAWSGLQVDVRALPHESFGAAMQYFTGSKEHNVVLRTNAIKQGLTLNEYGLFTIESNQRVAGESEEEVYARLGYDVDSA